MDEMAFSKLLKNSEARKADAGRFVFRRYLFDSLANTPAGTHAGICGLRGIGKTVLLLQLANAMKDSFYFSSDAEYLEEYDLYDIMRFVASRGWKHLFIDEIHTRSEWKSALKTAYDENLARVFFSGSSALELRKGADLSRRALLYHMKPVSFREHLVIKKGIRDAGRISPQALFEEKTRAVFASSNSEFAGYVAEYHSFGGLAYPSVNPEQFSLMLSNSLEKIIYSDLPRSEVLKHESVESVKKILQWIAISPPAELSYSSLGGKLSVSKPTLMKIVDAICRMGLVMRVLPCGKDLVRKEPKLYLAPPFRTHIARSVLREPDAGALREEFFVSHADKLCYLKGNRGQKTPDFRFEGRTVEVGGAGKNFGQEPEFILKDSEEFTGKSIPLYMAGFLY
ncbi:TPA: ATP-binding protein [Candidatus Micrarchaeota archaeon]|nr:ATP-binding protein [Candidatus Micrarchaeota archaeon]HIH30812.1 ATP-binding protein [Candidatus Micrarchaeota archaeon]